MVRPDILEHAKEEIKASMEEVLGSLEQAGEGTLCDLDAINALDALRARGFFTRASTDTVVVLEGPLIYYNHKKGKFLRTDHHTVSQINKAWVFDLASKPGKRVYYNLEDYKENSGIKLPAENGKK
ncbi:MAG TPA: hypothetical protein VF185_00530 [Patescibacteria group bacterium]